MIYPPEQFVEGFVRLRRSTLADAHSVFEATSSEGVTRFMDWPRHTERSATEAFFAGCAERWQAGTEFHWVIERTDVASTAGCIALRVCGHAADFGYFLLPQFWGQGIAYTAAHQVLAWLKQQPGIFRVSATADSENTRSLATLGRLGMVQEGTLRMATVRPNISTVPRDTVVFGLCRGDF